MTEEEKDEVQIKCTKKDTRKYLDYNFKCGCGQLHEPVHPELIELYIELTNRLERPIKIRRIGMCEEYAKYLQKVDMADDVLNSIYPGRKDTYITSHTPYTVDVMDDESGELEESGMAHIAMDLEIPHGLGINGFSRIIASKHPNVRVIKAHTMEKKYNPHILHFDLTERIHTFEAPVPPESDMLTSAIRKKLKTEDKVDEDGNYLVDGFLFEGVPVDKNVRKPLYWKKGIR